MVLNTDICTSCGELQNCSQINYLTMTCISCLTPKETASNHNYIANIKTCHVCHYFKYSKTWVNNICDECNVVDQCKECLAICHKKDRLCSTCYDRKLKQNIKYLFFICEICLEYKQSVKWHRIAGDKACTQCYYKHKKTKKTLQFCSECKKHKTVSKLYHGEICPTCYQKQRKVNKK